MTCVDCDSLAKELIAAHRDLRQRKAVIECYRVMHAAAGACGRGVWDPALVGAMEACLEDLGEPLLRTDGMQLSGLHHAKGIEAVLSKPTRDCITMCREEKRIAQCKAGAERRAAIMPCSVQPRATEAS